MLIRLRIMRGGKKGYTRTDRRRLETRGRLIAAAQDVFARKGIDGATIADITEAADVGLGTFYHHFNSKDSVFDALSVEMAELEGAALDAATAAMSDPAEVMAACIRHVVRRVTDHPSWGWFVLRTGLALPRSSAPLVRRCARDLRAGIKAGRFQVDDAVTAHAAICGAVVGVIQARLLATAPPDADEHLAMLVLRLLGVNPREAAAIARRPLPNVDGLPFPRSPTRSSQRSVETPIRKKGHAS